MPLEPTATIHVRPAALADADLLIAGNLAMALESEGRRLDRETVSQGVCAALADPGRGRYFVAEMDGVPAGQAMVTAEWSDWRNGWFWWVQSVYVLLEHRRKGVFRAIYGHVREEARQAGDVCGLRLYVEQDNEQALATYRALGMQVSGYRVCEEDWSGRL